MNRIIVQVFQLIRGGRERSLQLRSLLPTLEAIKTLALLPAEQVDALRVAYLFLRRLEICCKAWATSRPRPCQRMNCIAPGWRGRWIVPTGLL